MLPPMYPVKEEPPERSTVRSELLPTRTAPVSSWPLAFSAAVLLAPLQPSLQTESRTFPSSSFTSVTPLRVMTALVLVTWNICPFLLVRLPPVMVKLDVPLSASPDMDW